MIMTLNSVIKNALVFVESVCIFFAIPILIPYYESGLNYPLSSETTVGGLTYGYALLT